MLDLAGTETAPAADLQITSAAGEAPAHLDDTALVVDDWGLRKGRELLGESERLQKTGLDEKAVADMHAAAFEPEPQLTPGCVDKLRHDFCKQLLETPEYAELHASTMLNQLAAEIATAGFSEQYAKLREEHDKPTRAKPGTPAAETEKEMRTVAAVGKALEEAG